MWSNARQGCAFDQGFAYHAAPFSGAGTKPWRELATVLALRRVLRRERVDLVLSYTPKGNLYAALAGRGLALGMMTAVVTLASAALAPAMGWLIAEQGFRIGYATEFQQALAEADLTMTSLSDGVKRYSAS